MPARKKATRKVAKKTAKRTTAKKKTVRKTTARKKAPAKKKTTRKAVKKTTARAKAPAAAAPGKRVKSVKEPMTKTALFSTLAEGTGMAKKDVSNVFEYLAELIQLHVKRSGPQIFTLPGLLKIKVVRKPATKARKGINPFTGEETVFKAKPARNVVKILALKKLKEMAN